MKILSDILFIKFRLVKNLIVILSFLIFGVFNAQKIIGKIISKEDNKPISYARIGIENDKIGAIADENGNYSIDLTNVDRNKNLTVQFGGFENYVQKIQTFLDSKIYTISLSEKVTNIKEVIITLKKYVNKNWGTNAKTQNIRFGFNSSNNIDERSKEFAVYFNNKKKIKIQKININIADFKSEKPLLLNFNIYSVSNNLPFQSILSENLTVEFTKDKIIDGTFSFDISDKNIWINQQDFFVSMQIMNDFSGWFYLSGAMFRTVYYRNYYSTWEKTSIAQPSLNIDIKIEK